MKLPVILCILLTITALSAHSAETTAPTAENSTNAPAEAKVPGDAFTNSVQMELVKVPGDFWAGKYEVTQAQYEKVMDANPSAFPGAGMPVNNVSWNDAMSFCDAMTRLDIKKKRIPEGFHYILPTEDEWTNLVADASLDQAVTSLANRITSPSTVGSLGANSLGLYDIRGNVMEFVLSDDSKPYRFLKGGSWASFADANLRPEFRWYCKPDEATNTFGFRCLLKGK